MEGLKGFLKDISNHPHLRRQDLPCSQVDNLIGDPSNGCTTLRPQGKAVEKTDDASQEGNLISKMSDLLFLNVAAA